MARILTITINPALDKSITVKELVPEKKLKADNVKTEPGGGGINVSRALHKLGMESEALYLAGGYTGKALTDLLVQEGVKASPIETSGDTRENFIVYDTASGKQYRFGMSGPVVETSALTQLIQRLEIEDDLAYIVVSGSIPENISASFFKQLGMLVRKKKSRLIVDTSGPALLDAVREGVFMIKPNLGELAALQNATDKMDMAAAITAATELIHVYSCEMIAVSLGAEGALLVTPKNHYHCKPPAVKVLSTVGAGDSMVAGLVFALVNGYAESEILAYGVAAGTAATLHLGTELCNKTDTRRLFRSIVDGQEQNP